MPRLVLCDHLEQELHMPGRRLSEELAPGQDVRLLRYVVSEADVQLPFPSGEAGGVLTCRHGSTSSRRTVASTLVAATGLVASFMRALPPIRWSCASQADHAPNRPE